MSKRARDDGSALVSALRNAEMASHVMFQPSHEQRQLKSKFWIDFKSNPIADDRDVTPALVEEVLGRDIRGWLSQPQFWPWFSTRDSTKQFLEVAAEKAAEMAIMLLDPSTPLQDNARVQLIKIVLDFSGRAPASRKEIKWADREVENLSESELDSLIDKLTKKQLSNTKE